ncbi:MAG: PAS domain-containing sensor histidine kinase [bacterium]
MTGNEPRIDYRSLFDHMIEGCQIIDPGFRYLYVNEAVARQGRHTKEELVGRTMMEMYPGIERTEMFSHLRTCMERHTPQRLENEFVFPDGNKGWFALLIEPIPEGAFIFSLDITERKLIEHDLEDAKIAARNIIDDLAQEKERAQGIAEELEKFKLAVDGVSEHIVITDPEGIILFANPAAERITGFTRAEILGKKSGSRELWGGLMDTDFYRTLWQTIKVEKKTFSGEIKNHRKSGEEYDAHTVISPILDDEGGVEFFVAIERDITKEKEVDKAKSEFVSLASHQLRTPLTSINWYSEMLLGDEVAKTARRQDEYLAKIHAGSQRMVVLVDALLDVSRIELGTLQTELKPVSVTGLLGDVIGEQKPQIDAKRITVATDFPKQVPVLETDPSRVRMIFQNLLSNGIKYTPSGGRISISVSLEDSRNVRVVFSDTGYGIPKKDQDKIFTKMFRADNIKTKGEDGTGLGLYIVKSVLTALGGSVRFESEENKGTTFYVTLPLAVRQ